MSLPQNLFLNFPVELKDEFVEQLTTSEVGDTGGAFRIERVVSPAGYASEADDWYDQEQSEFVMVMQGSGKLEFLDDSENGGERSFVELQAGDWVDIKAHRKHRVDQTDPNGPTVWLCVFYE